MSRARKLAKILSAFVALACGPARAGSSFPPIDQIGFVQHLGSAVPLELAFHDETGRRVLLGEFFRGEPVVLAFAYYGCPGLCTTVLNSMFGTLRAAGLDARDGFQVVVVSIDPTEQPSLADMKKQSYIKRFAPGQGERRWHFLTGTEASIRALTGTAGFRYAYDPSSGQYAHPAGFMLLTPEGRLSRYYLGLDVRPRDLRLGMTEASLNRIGSPVDRLLLLCYQYDPSTGRYGVVVMNLVRLGGALTLGALGAFVGLTLRRERRQAEV